MADALPDSRLVQARWTPVPAGIRSDHLILAGHVHPTLLKELGEFFRAAGPTGAPNAPAWCRC
ncbi:hypothetical protein ACF1G5_23065 [Streptomyces coeruleorubidus]|uniref:hypothetical protein n=1 Tax=Streptomyces coeruleorubidus TaxID=116188 RepID=UPI0037009BEA